MLEGIFSNCDPLLQTTGGALFSECAQAGLSAAQVGMSTIHYKEQLLEEEIRRLASKTRG